jgi:hypothetical protein
MGLGVIVYALGGVYWDPLKCIYFRKVKERAVDFDTGWSRSSN